MSKYTASGPSATSTAPTIPPMSACDELDGSPKYHVIRFQAIAPDQPGEHREEGDVRRVHHVLGHRGGHLSERNAPTKLSTDA